jgi:ankyrin repeat protein
LHYAASAADQAQHQVAAFLLERGAEVDALAPNDTTPLMLSAGYGSEDTIRILLARGADITRRTARGLSAADFARYAGRDRLAQALQALVDQAEARPR